MASTIPRRYEGAVTSLRHPREATPRPAAAAGDRAAVMLLLPVAMLLIVGLGAVLSASSVVAIREGVDHLFYFKRQIVWIVAGLGLLVAASRIPYRMYARFAVPILVVAIAGLVATLALGDVRGGSRRWIEVGPVTIQASELAKFAVVVFLARAFTTKEAYLHRFAHFFWPVAICLGSVGVLLLAEPDLGTTILIAAAAFAVLGASKAPVSHVVFLGALAAGAVTLLAFAQPYRKARIVSFLDPLADPLGNGLQAVQSLVALETGGWFGVGLGASRARWSFLPNAHTDFIFSIIGEEIGLAGALVVVALFVGFGVIGLVIAYRAADGFGRLLAVGLVAWLTFQALINIGGVAVVLPITGVPLPFISSGGSAMLANLFAVGVLVNIARTGKAHR
ncbi:MAG TPA: putative lipid II flippase FtsW [Acidimicrobiia bacterium]